MTISKETLAKYLKPGDIFYETGTRWGDTVIKAFELQVREVHSCENNLEQYKMAVAHVEDAAPRYKGLWSIECMDSVSFLAFRTAETQNNVVVFLDAHSDTASPVVEEVDILLRWAVLPKTILIDDLRCMEAWKVNLRKLEQKLSDAGYLIHYEDGVIPKDILVAIREDSI